MFLIQSKVTGKEYEPKNCVFLRNTLQVSKYLQHGAELLDLTVAYDGKITYVFSRDDTYELYQLWQEKRL